MSNSVFISHASADFPLAEEVVKLIEEGIGVPEKEIFCSSLLGYGIPTGKNFVTFIKDQLLAPKVVVIILTPAYLESRFCVAELGAAWIKSHDIFPILVPPLEHRDIKDVLLGTQVAKVDDDIGYNNLRDALIDVLDFELKSHTRWDTSRRAFLKALGPILKQIKGPQMVPGKEFEAKIAELEEARADLDEAAAEIRNLKRRLIDTEQLKDKTDVFKIRAQHGDENISKRFHELTDAVKNFKAKTRSSQVMKFVLSEYYDKPYQINWNYYRDDFENAIRLGLISVQHNNEQVNWSKRQIEDLRQALSDLDEFVKENAEELQESEGMDTPLEPEDQDFWEHHYEV